MPGAVRQHLPGYHEGERCLTTLNFKNGIPIDVVRLGPIVRHVPDERSGLSGDMPEFEQQLDGDPVLVGQLGTGGQTRDEFLRVQLSGQQLRNRP